MRVSEMGEDALIAAFAEIYRSRTGVLVGIGDDGAVVESPAELPDPGPALIWMLPLYLESNRHLGVTEIADPADAKHAGQILSGRGARIAYQSWQI